MQVAHAARMPWGENLAAHRQGRMAHKLLFEGEEGSPDNFAWVVADEGSDYFSPRHRHAWDQVRLCLEGSIPIGRELRLDRGEVGYFPEGVPYGPQQGGPDRLTLVLQVGGASGHGYLSARQLREAHAELAREGVFEGGVFRRSGGAGKANQDAYEAIWRHVTGAPIDYPKPTYRTPVLMRPEGFAWRPVEGFDGVERRRLGTFGERGVQLAMLRLEPGSVWRLQRDDTRRLVFVVEGAGRWEAGDYQPLSALRLEPGEAATVAAGDRTRLFVISLAMLAPAANGG